MNQDEAVVEAEPSAEIDLSAQAEVSAEVQDVVSPEAGDVVADLTDGAEVSSPAASETDASDSEVTSVDVSDAEVSDSDVSDAEASDTEASDIEASDEDAVDVVDVTDKEPESLIGGDGPTIESALEAILMVSDQPMNAVELATLLGVPTEEVEATLLELAKDYVAARRGFELRIVDGGWRFFSAQHCAEVVAKFATDGRSAKLTQAALETLAVVAYKQPVSRARIGAIRGVNVDGVMRTLMTRGLVTEIETDPATGAVLYGTTGFFLERMGLSSLSDLPPIEDHLPDLAVLDELIEPGV